MVNISASIYMIHKQNFRKDHVRKIEVEIYTQK